MGFETIITFLVNGVVAIMGMIAGFYLGTKKYIFEKTYDQKLLCTTDLYRQIVRLEFALKEYVHFIGADMTKESISKKIESLNKIKKDFQQFQHKFWEIEIVLDDDTTIQIEKFLKTYIEITSKLSVSNISQQLGDFNQSFDGWDKSFGLVSSELAKIKNEIKKEFKRTLKKYS